MTRASTLTQCGLDLWRNLKSGLRLAFAMPISLLSFRVSVRQLVVLGVLDILGNAMVDYVRAGAESMFAPYAIVYEGFNITALLLIGAVLSAGFRQPHLKLALPVMVLASEPVLNLLGLILTLPGNQGELLGYPVSVGRLLADGGVVRRDLLAGYSCRADAAPAALLAAIAGRYRDCCS